MLDAVSAPRRVPFAGSIFVATVMCKWIIHSGATSICISFRGTRTWYDRDRPSEEGARRYKVLAGGVAVSSMVSATCGSITARSQASAPARRTAAEAELTEKDLTRRADP